VKFLLAFTTNGNVLQIGLQGRTQTVLHFLN